MHVPRMTLARRCSRAALAFVAIVATFALASSEAAAQQTGTVNGIVVDATTRQPLAGAQINVVGTGISALSQRDGEFLIRNVPAGEQAIRVVQIGYRDVRQTVEVPAGGVAEVNFYLEVEAIGLNAIVVTMTGEQQSREISNAVGTINVDEAVETAPVTSITDVLQGRSPGVTILQSSGTVGTGAVLKVRGNSSISLNNTPIIYVDGVRVENDISLGGGVGGQEYSRLNDISPQDIAKIDVLKGPAAATLYGTEAAAGVIQITTKRGIVGEPQFQVKQEFGFNQRDESTEFMPTVINAQSWYGPAAADTVYSMNLLETEDPFRSGTINKTSASVRGGINNFTYYISGQHDFEEGVLPNNQAERYFGRANFDVTASDVLDMNVNVGYTSSDASLPDNDNNGFGYIGVAQLGFPWGRRYQANDFDTGTPIETCLAERELVRIQRNAGFDGNIADFRNAFGTTVGTYCGGAENSGFLNGRSFDKIATLQNTQNVERFTGSTTFNWRPTTWLSNKFTLGYDNLATRDENLTPVDPDRPFGSDSDGYKFIQNYGTRNLSLDYVGTLNFDINPSWSTTTSLGTQYFHRTLHGSWSEGRVFPAGTPTVGNAATTEGSEFYEENKSLGIFAQQQFGFQNRVFLTAGVRADDNSAFGADYALVFYPKVGASWVVSEESWFPQSRFLEQFKLRASWGESGKQPGLFDALQTYSAASVALRGTELSGAFPANIGNVELAPEVGQEWEVGFDVSALRGRVSAEVTYYDQVTQDAIVARNLAPSGGFPQSVFDNVGEMTNSGFELGLNVTPIESQNLVWDLGFNLATNDNEITQLESPIIYGLGGSSQRHTQGSPFGSYYSPEVAITQVNDPSECDGIATADGRCAYFAQADTSYLSDGVTIDRVEGVDVFLGHPTPELEGSISTSLRLFENITLSALVDFKRGHQLFNSTEEFICGWIFGGGPDAMCPQAQERQEYVDPNTGETVLVPTDEALSKQFASQEGFEAPWIEDADFTRLRSVSLRLAVPSRFTDQFGIGGASISLMGQNLATWTDYTGMDPEINFAGQSNATRAEFLTMPLTRRFVTSVTINF